MGRGLAGSGPLLVFIDTTRWIDRGSCQNMASRAGDPSEILANRRLVGNKTEVW